MNPKTGLLMGLVGLLSLFFGTPASAGSGKHLEELIDTYVSSFPARERINSIILVAARERILFRKGYGFARIDSRLPNTIRTGFQIGSISKAFTAMIALKLAEQGQIDLNKTISVYLSYYPAEMGSRITFGQLLSHTSGIPHHFQVMPDYFRSHDHYFHFPRELPRLFWNTPLRHEPGEKFTYSSPGYYIIGAILQQVSKRSPNELLQELICGPLGLKDTYVENNLGADRNLAEGYFRGISCLVRAYGEDKSTALGAGDIVSTAHDLFLWQRALNLKGDRVLSAKSKELLFRPILEGSPMTMSGPHFEIPYEDGSKKLAVSILNGSSSGYSCCLNRQTELDRCVIVLSNINGDDVSRIADDIGDIVLRRYYGLAIGEEALLTRIPPPAAAIDAEAWQSVGDFYRTAPGSYVGIILGDGKCFYLDFNIDSGIGNVMELVPKTKKNFFLGHNQSLACSFSNQKGGVFARLEASRKGWVFQRAERASVPDDNASQYQGYYCPRELQKSFRLRIDRNGLIAERFLSGSDRLLTHLEKDLFGNIAAGFLRFRRDADGSIAGFEVFSMDCDRYFGSEFVRIAD
jgi:CubicO group peptidase (beta-lactamase class C family)